MIALTLNLEVVSNEHDWPSDILLVPGLVRGIAEAAAAATTSGSTATLAAAVATATLATTVAAASLVVVIGATSTLAAVITTILVISAAVMLLLMASLPLVLALIATSLAGVEGLLVAASTELVLVVRLPWLARASLLLPPTLVLALVALIWGSTTILPGLVLLPILVILGVLLLVVVLHLVNL